ncbi:MAG: leucine-rich repeat domain-containing protein [Promethearchaeota archaeon]
MHEFIINDYLRLKLIDNRTYIFINDELFNHCKYILLDIPVEEVEDFDEIDSIDEAAEKLDHSLERRFEKNITIPPETEFWGHASNLQCWWENGYDTRLLHSNLAFPLLKKLTEAGDPQAKRVFKEEIAKRFMKGHLPVTTYLIKEGYLFYLSKEEFETILESKALSEIDPNDKNAWENLGYLYSVNGEYNKAIDAYNHIIAIDSNDIRTWLRLGLAYRKSGQYNDAINAYNQALKIDSNHFVIWRDFDKLLEEPYFLYLFLDNLPENLKKNLVTRLISGNNKNPDKTITNLLSTELKALNIKHIIYNNKIFEVKDNHLSLSNQNIERISEIIGLKNLSDLQSLSLHFNQISEIKGFEKLRNLKQLVLNSNQISDITGLENLKYLEKLELKNNQISEIKGLQKLVNLDYLNLPKNKIKEIKGLETLINLKQLVLNFNHISEIKGLENLSNLEILDLRYNQIKNITGLEKLENLRELYLSSNPLSKIAGLETLKNLEILDLSNTKITVVPDFLTSLSSLKKLILINCNVKKFPKSLEEIIISYTREDRKELLQKGFDFTFDDIELFEKSSSKRAIMGGKPTESFKKWFKKRKDIIK